MVYVAGAGGVVDLGLFRRRLPPGDSASSSTGGMGCPSSVSQCNTGSRSKYTYFYLGLCPFYTSNATAYDVTRALVDGICRAHWAEFGLW